MAIVRDPVPEYPSDARSETSVLPAYTTTENTFANETPHANTYETSKEEKARLRESISESTHPLERTSSENPIQPTPTAPGHASASTLSRGLQVVTSDSHASSGFAYPPILAEHGVTAADWLRFTSLITQAASMKTNDWVLAVGGGVGTLFVAGIFIGWLAFIPAVLVGRSIHKRAEIHNLQKARLFGDLEQVLLSWNQTFFAPRGLLIRLDLPGEQVQDIVNMDIATPARSKFCTANKAQRCKTWDEGKWAKFVEKKAKVEAKMDAKLEAKMAKMDARVEAKMAKVDAKMAKRDVKLAYRRGRIVILPLSKGADEKANLFAGVPDLYGSPSNGSQLDEKETRY